MSDPLVPSDDEPAQDRSASRLQPGTEVRGIYRIVRHIQDGGMGELYLGEEIDTETHVAMKAIKPELVNRSGIKEEFIEEAKRLRRLQHKGIVRYFLAPYDPDIDRLFMVMDFIEGVSLKEYIQHNGPLRPDEARLLMQQLCEALSEAHAKNIIHRDLSPDNVMLRAGRVADAVLIDFGIAKAIDPTDDAQNVERRFVGKYKYVSPEQCGLFGAAVGPRADIYGLGLLIARVVSATPLPMGAGLTEAREARQVVPDLSHLPSELQPFLRYLLQPDPADRPPTMLHVLQMAQNPQTVPAKYGGFGGVNDDEATIFEPEATIFPTDPSHMFPPSDRSVPPVAVKPSLQTAPAVTPDPGQPVAQTFAPPLYPAPSESDVDGLKAPPRFDLGDERSHPNPLPDRPSPHGGAGKMWLLAIFIVAGLGGAAIFAIPFFGSSQPDEIGSAAPVATQHEPGIATPEPVLEGGSAIARLAAARTPIGSERAGVLAAAPMDPCHYVARIESGFDRGRLAVFAPDPTVGIETTLGAFMAAFDERPATVPFSVTEEQCAVLEFARALQGRGARDPDLLQPVTVITLDDPVLDVRAEDLRGRPFWFVAIDPQGLVSRLDQFRVETTNAGNRYRIQFSGAPSERGDQYLLLALASDEALVSAATMSSGVHARAILDAVAQELLSQAVPAGVALSYVFFTHQPGSVAP